MSYDSVLDPASAAAIANEALAQALAALPRAAASANAAAVSAAAAAASQTAISTLLAGLGIPHRWSGTVLQIRLPDGSYGTAVDLKGDKGDVGPVPVLRQGTVAEGDFAVEINATNPAYPLLNFTLKRGPAAWTPILAGIVADARRLFQIVDWIGGDGTKPSTGQYVGGAGLVTDPNAAVDYRGAPGGAEVSGSPQVGHLALFSGLNAITDGGAISSLGKSIVSAATATAVKLLLAIAATDVSGLGGAALLNVGSSVNTVAAGNDSRLVGAEQAANKGTANGYAGLDSTGKVPTGQLPASVLGDVQYQGSWNATANAPAIPAASAANKGWYYVVQTAGTTAINGQADWQVGDWLVSDGAAWDKIDNTDLVTSVAGLVGPISAAALKIALAVTSNDIGDASATGRSLLTATSPSAAAALLPSNVGTRTISAAATVQASDKKGIIFLTGGGSFTLTGPAASAGFSVDLVKRDGGGVVIFTPPSGTVDGLPSICIYQETVRLYCDGTNWATIGRQRGWIDIGTTTIITATSGIVITAGFVSDPELRDVRFDVNKIMFTAAGDYLTCSVQKGGSTASTGYLSQVSGGYTTNSFYGQGPTNTFIPGHTTPLSDTVTTLPVNVAWDIFNFGDTAGHQRTTLSFGFDYGAAGTLAEGRSEGVHAAAGAITGVAMATKQASTFTATLIQKAFRR